MIWVCMGGIGIGLTFFEIKVQVSTFLKSFNKSASFMAFECLKMVHPCITFTILSWIQGQSLIGEIAHVHIFSNLLLSI